MAGPLFLIVVREAGVQRVVTLTPSYVEKADNQNRITVCGEIGPRKCLNRSGKLST